MNPHQECRHCPPADTFFHCSDFETMSRPKNVFIFLPLPHIWGQSRSLSHSRDILLPEQDDNPHWRRWLRNFQPWCWKSKKSFSHWYFAKPHSLEMWKLTKFWSGAGLFPLLTTLQNCTCTTGPFWPNDYKLHICGRPSCSISQNSLSINRLTCQSINVYRLMCQIYNIYVSMPNLCFLPICRNLPVVFVILSGSVN